MEWSNDQTRALDRFQRWLAGSEPVFALAGYAGTGKTTLLQHIIGSMDEPPQCAAPTGKAATVLGARLKGARVSTIHQLLYCPVGADERRLEALMEHLANHPNDAAARKEMEAERAKVQQKGPRFAVKQNASIAPGEVVFVDEASMVTAKMHADLLVTGARVCYVGDPGQLPPVRDRGFFENVPPDATLETVHRVALENPITRLSTEVRAGRPQTWFGKHGPLERARREAVEPSRFLEADVVLTGKNASRRKLNRFFRHKHGHAAEGRWWPRAGEPLVCLRNERRGEVYLPNGGLCRAEVDFELHEEADMMLGAVAYEGARLEGLDVLPWPFKVTYKEDAPEPLRSERADRTELDYGYALTVHKSQGSEWDRVVLADDGYGNGEVERRRWLYTAVTRAKKELLWVTQ